MAFQSISQLLAAAGDKPLWQAVLEDDCRDRGGAPAESWEKMSILWAAMKAAVEDYDPARRSPSGLSGGNAALLEGPGSRRVVTCPDALLTQRGIQEGDAVQLLADGTLQKLP